MKKIFFLLFIVLISWKSDLETNNGFSKKTKTDLQKLNLNGKIQSTTEFIFNAEKALGGIAKKDNRYDKEEIIFNTKGNKTKETLVLAQTKFEYDNLNNLIKETALFDDGSFRYINKFKYDSNNELIEIGSYEKNDILGEKEIYLKENGKLIITAYGGERNDFRRKQANTYNEKGDLIEVQKYTEKDEVFYTQTIKYDKNANQIEIIHSSPTSESYNYTEKKEYNSKNDLVVHMQYKPGNVLSFKTVNTYKYDSNGNWIIKTEDNSFYGMKYIERSIKYY